MNTARLEVVLDGLFWKQLREICHELRLLEVGTRKTLIGRLMNLHAVDSNGAQAVAAAAEQHRQDNERAGKHRKSRKPRTRPQSSSPEAKAVAPASEVDDRVVQNLLPRFDAAAAPRQAAPSPTSTLDLADVSTDDDDAAACGSESARLDTATSRARTDDGEDGDDNDGSSAKRARLISDLVL